MESGRLIQRVVRKCTYLNDIEYKYLRNDLINEEILTSPEKSQIDAKKSNLDKIHLLFYDYAPRLSIDNFKRLIQAINISCSHVARELSDNLAQELQRNNPASFSGVTCISAQGDYHSRSLPKGFSDLPPSNTLGSPILSGNECIDDLKRFQMSEEATTVQEVASNSSRNNDPDDQDEPYKMETQPRGVAFIINNQKFDHLKWRSGSDADKEKLHDMFKYLGWLVTSKDNLTAKAIDTYLKKFAKHESLTEVSAIAVVILTHGMDDDIYFGMDGKLNKDGTAFPGSFITRFQVMQNFTPTACPAMKARPKWFIMQACRGGEEDIPSKPKDVQLKQKNSSSAMSSDSPTQQKLIQGSCGKMKEVPETGDMCFLFTSSKGYKAYRMKSSGSPVITALTEIVKEKSHQTEFSTMMKRVIGKLYKTKLPEGKLTLPEFSSHIHRDWFLNPPPS